MTSSKYPNYFAETHRFIIFVQLKIRLMKRLLYLILAFTALYADAQTADSIKMPVTPFEYPLAPDSIESLQGKTSYVMLKFWDKADMKKLMADTTQFRKAFHDYVSFIPFAHVDSIKKSVGALTSRYANDPKALLLIANMAEKELFGPEADFWSEEPYMLFIRPLLTNKKVKEKEKQHYLDQIKMLNASQIGSNMAPISYTTRHGAKHQLYDQKGEYVLVLFQNDDCSDCSMTRLRLEADIATGNVVKDGRLKIVIINPGKDSQEWRSAMANYPYDWEIGSAPDAAKEIDLRIQPTSYLLDKDYQILMKNLSLNQILAFTAALNQQPKAEKKSEGSTIEN